MKYGGSEGSTLRLEHYILETGSSALMLQAKFGLPLEMKDLDSSG
jgi:hypothetical protein